MTVVSVPFTASGTFTPPEGVTALDGLLLVGGGGAGGSASTSGTGGGGAGGVRWLTGVAVTPGVPVTVTVGAGGAAGSNGGTTSFGALTALGGGKGSSNVGTGGSDGGSGGGAASGSIAGAAGSGPVGGGTAGQGNSGGTGWGGGTSNRKGGGGGGAGAAGTNAVVGSAGANGGAGLNMSANVGTAVGAAGWFGGGGGGGSATTGTATSTGGQGGGGAGGNSAGAAGAANTGGGGGAGGGSAGAGGSGFVMVVYTEPEAPAPDPETEGWSVYMEVIHPGGLFYPYQVNDDDLPPGAISDLPPEGVLADNLTHRRNLPEGVPWPCQPDPQRLDFNLLAEDASTATVALVKGSSVLCQVFSPRLPEGAEFPFFQTPLREFLGRASEVTTEALEVGVQVSCTAVDWTASLAEAVIGDTPWSEEDSKARLERILALVNTEYPTIPGALEFVEGPHSSTPGDTADPAVFVPLTARDVDAQPALGLVQEVLSAWAFDVTNIDGSPISPHQPARYQLGMTYAASLPSGWTLTPRLAASTLAAVEVPADQVDISSKWVQRLASAITNVAVTVKNGTADKIIRRKVAGAVVDDTYQLSVPIDWDDPGILTPVLIRYAGDDAAVRLAQLLRPTVAVTANAWQAEEFTWLLDQAPPGANLPDLGELVTVTGIRAGANPGGTDTVEGLLDSDQFTIRDGKPAVSFTLRPRSRA